MPLCTLPLFPAAAACCILQGEFVDKLAELIMKTYGASNSIAKADIYFIQDKKQQPYFDEDSDE